MLIEPTTYRRSAAAFLQFPDGLPEASLGERTEARLDRFRRHVCDDDSLRDVAFRLIADITGDAAADRLVDIRLPIDSCPGGSPSARVDGVLLHDSTDSCPWCDEDGVRSQCARV